MPPLNFPIHDATEWWDNFKKLLDDNNEWPAEYVFKFIAPRGNVADLKDIFIGYDIDIKASSRGSYHSVTSRIRVSTSEEVIEIYKRAGAIKGVISL